MFETGAMTTCKPETTSRLYPTRFSQTLDVNRLLQIAQSESSEISSPLALAFWYVVFPILILALIFGGGWYLRNVGRRERERKRRDQSSDER